MIKSKIIRYVQSIIVIPMLSIAIPLSGVYNIFDITSSNVNNIEINDSVITTQDDENLKKQAEQIDSFFESIDAPLEGYGMKFVVEAKENNIDWRLLPAIAMRETTGGKQSCKNPKAPNNNFGWFSCKQGFKSVDTSIEHIAKTISGNNPRSKYYQKGMKTDDILKTYNPDYIVPGYSKQVIRIMKMINKEDAII